jgi:pimeloyl-ACP methyl ester carboxylesterase
MTASDVGHDTKQPAGRMFAGPADRLEGEPDHRAPLILLNQVAFGRTMWRPALAELRTLDPGRRVFTVDVPGPGRSPAWRSCDIEGMTEGVHRAAEAAELRSPVVVGHCAAAVVATVYAARYPARGVVNVAQCLRSEPEPGWPVRWPPSGRPGCPTCSSPVTSSSPDTRTVSIGCSPRPASRSGRAAATSRSWLTPGASPDAWRPPHGGAGAARTDRSALIYAR